tara:strand:+ start:2405 stop:2860 length:456 start_codon:yes stop_codon:yes gene_type:complete
MSEITGNQAMMIDLRSDYTVNEIRTFFEELKPEGRAVHTYATKVTDSIFPFAYGALFILLSAFLLKNITNSESNWIYLSLFPLLLMVVDFKENFNTLSMLSSYPDLTSEMVDSASKVTSLKGVLVNISMGLPIILGLIWIVKLGLKRMKIS